MVTKGPPLPPVTRAVILLAIAASLGVWLGIGPAVRLLGPGPFTEPWRLVTATLLHSGMIHLAFNALWTWQLGAPLELRLGSAKMLLLYVALATISSFVSQLFEGPGIGLSGVVYGLFAMLWVAKRRGLALGRFLSEPVTKLFVAWFFIAIAIDYANLMNIGNVAHGAGAVAGGLFGLLLSRERTAPGARSQARLGEQESRQTDEVGFRDHSHQ